MKKLLAVFGMLPVIVLPSLSFAASAIDLTAATTQVGDDKAVLIAFAVVAGIALVALKWAKRVRSAG